LLFDLGLGKRVATVIAKRMAKLLMEQGALPNTALLSGALLQVAEGIGQQSLVVDGDESASTMMASCCSPIPGDSILGYLGHGEGLVIHRSDCAAALRLTRKDEDRMIDAHWADDIERAFAVAITVSVKDGQGVLAQVTSALAQADANIVHIEMGQEQAEQTTDLRFRIAIKDLLHLHQVLKSRARVPSVVKVVRG
jgi:GTP pyrophosphokinase